MPIQGMGKQSPSLDQKSCLVTLQRGYWQGWRIMSIFAKSHTGFPTGPPKCLVLSNLRPFRHTVSSFYPGPTSVCYHPASLQGPEFVSFCCYNKLPQTSWLHTTQIVLPYSSVDGCHWAKTRALVGLHTFLGALGRIHFLAFSSF